MNIVFIGSGNVATHLSKGLIASGHRVVQVFSRSLINAKILARATQAAFTNVPADIRKDADVYIIAVSDNAIEKIASVLRLGKKLVVHTSGTVPMKVLKKTSENMAVFYPMQTFSKGLKMDWRGIPVFIEANKDANEKKLVRMAHQLAGKKNVHLMNSNQRRVVHLAAVFANNFPNHLFAIAEKILKKNHLNFDLMRPLIWQTANKIRNHSPAGMQTGPAKRNDRKVINEHIRMLASFPGYRKIYRQISESIIRMEKTNK